MVADPIADLITRVKNANDAGQKVASVPYSKMALSIMNLLEQEGFVGLATKRGKKVKKTIDVELIYGENNTPKIKGVKRLSKLSKRVYIGAKDIKPVRYGKGRIIISTPNGILTGKEAKKQNVGGEPLFSIW